MPLVPIEEEKTLQPQTVDEPVTLGLITSPQDDDNITNPLSTASDINKNLLLYQYGKPPTTEERLNQALISQTFDKPLTDAELGLVKETPQLSISDFKKNPEVVERAIRAMSYVDGTTYDDGSKASDRFVDYARDADFNLTHGAIRLSNILSQQEKQSPEDIQFREDISFLYNEFYKVLPDGRYKYDAQGFAENLGLTGDILAGALTDLANWGALLALPFTSGGSAGARVAAGEAARQGLKAAIKQTVKKSYDAIPKIPINPRSFKQTSAALGTEGFVFGSTDYLLRQQLFEEVDIPGYEEFSPTEMAISGGFGATIGLIPGVAIPAGYRYFDARALRLKQAEDSEQFKNIILNKEPERKDVKIINPNEPEATPNPNRKIVTLEEASSESLNLRNRDGNPESTHVERVADKEAEVYPTEILRTGTREVDIEDPEVEKPVIGGLLSRKNYEEALSTYLLFGKPTTYSRRLAEIDPNFDTFLRLIRHDSMDSILDNPIAVLNSTAKQQRSYQEQVRDTVGPYMGRMVNIVEDIQNFARQHPRYKDRGNFRVKNGTALNNDLYAFLNRGDVRGGVPIEVIEAGKDLRKIFDDVEKEAINAGFVFHSVPNFFPRYYKPAKLIKNKQNKERFASQLANDEDMSFADALTAVDDLLTKVYDDLDPTMGSLGQRKYKNLDTTNIQDLLVSDIQAAMSMYLNGMGRKIVRKKTFGFTQEEFEQKWLNQFFGGTTKATDEVTGRDVILDRLKARGFTESLIDTSNVGEYTRLNFLIRQNTNNQAIDLNTLLNLKPKDIKKLDDVANPKMLNVHLKQLKKMIDETNAEVLRPSDRDIINNAEGNNLTEVIDKLITNRMFAGDFILRPEKIVGSFEPSNVIYKGTFSNPIKKMTDEKRRVQKLYDYIIGTGGIAPGGSTSGWNAAANSILLAQSANKLGFATISSIPETLIPFLKSNPTIAMKAFYKTVNEESSHIFNNITTKEVFLPKNVLKSIFGDADMTSGSYLPFEVVGRSATRQELNQLNMVLRGSLAEAVQNSYSEGLGAISSGLSYKFYRSIFLDQYTKFMQVFAYNAGKIMISDHLDALSKMSAKQLNSKKGQRLRIPLVELGLDVDKGIKWYKDGAQADDLFTENIRASAARYVDEVVMNPGREMAQKPLFMNHWFGRVVFQLYSYPVAFGNTVFKNAIRDAKLSPLVNAPKNMAVLTLMLGMTRLQRAIKTGGESLEEDYDGEAILRDLDYMGVGGPLTLLYTASENQKYGDNEFTALLGLLGPTLGGAVIDAIKTPRPLYVFQKNILPYRNVLAKTNPDLIFKFDQLVKDLEDVIANKDYTEIQIRRLEDMVNKQQKDAGITDLQRELDRDPKFEGGPVSKDFPVSDVKDIAAERINPFTGEPYLEDEDERIQLRTGGTPKQNLLDRIQNYFTEEARKKRLKEKYDKEGIDYRMTEDGPEIIYEGTNLAKQLGVKGEPEPGLRNVMPVIEFASILGGKKLVTEGAETVFQSVAKSRMPKKVYHGTTRRDLTELRQPEHYQRFGVFASPTKQGTIKFTGNKGAIYEIDSSDISSLKNILRFNKNKVLNADKPSSKVLKLIDKDIAKLKNSKKTGLAKQEDLIDLRGLESFKRDMLDPNNYISGYGRSVDKFLNKNNYSVIETTPTFPKGNKTPNYIFTKDKTAINDKFLTKSETRINPKTGEQEKIYLIEKKDRVKLNQGTSQPMFEKRINNPADYPFLLREDGKKMTHRMADDGKMVYPMIQLQEDGTLKNYKNDFDGAREQAIKTGNYKVFETESEAQEYARGGYKTKEFEEYYK